MSALASEVLTEVELRSLRQFLAVAELRHFGRAAKRLGMTQPPLTQAIQKLEGRLGVPLFERTRRHVALSPAGTALVEPARQLLARAAALPELCRAAASGQLGSLRLGFVSTAGFGPLPMWLRSFRQSTPQVAVKLLEATSDVQLAALRTGELDAGLLVHAAGMDTEAHRDFEHLSVGREPLLFALPTAQTAKQRRLSPTELLSQPLIMFPRKTAPSLHDAILAFFHHHDAVPRIVQEAIQMQTIVNLVSAGLGVALVPRVVATFRRAGVTYRPLPRTLSHAPRFETSLVWPANSPTAVRRFVEHVRLSTTERR